MFSCIQSVPVFQVLPQSSVERLHQALRHRHFEEGEIVLHAGSSVRSLVVVQNGLLQLSRIGKSGREQVLRELGTGEFYGEMALFTDVVSEGDLVALRATQVCLLDRQALQAELQAAPQVAWPLVEAIARRLADAERTIGDLALLDVGERLASELLRLAAEGGRASEQGIEIQLPVTWAQLASRLGTTPESLSRRLKSFQGNGFIEFSGRQVFLRDVKGLQELVQGS